MIACWILAVAPLLGRALTCVGVMRSAPTSLRHFNDESPLGLRRILSQSTDSLNMRNRTLSVESLIDEGDCEGPGGCLVGRSWWAAWEQGSRKIWDLGDWL